MHSFESLVALFEQHYAASMPFPTTPAQLYEPCNYIMNLGGKRIRPILVLMANELFADIHTDAWHAATAVELFHNFTLVHDDIMDKAPLRRGFPTLHAKYGLTSGILSGDVLCIYAYQQLAKVTQSLPKVLETFNKAAIDVCEGQQLDMDFEQSNDISIEDYIEMISLKTSVLLAASLKIGALIGGSLGDNAHKIYLFGKNLGIAFQLQDDYLDAFGDLQKVGKQIGGDIKANKKTYLLLKALAQANDTERKQIDQLLLEDGEDKVAQMLELYRSTQADVACQQAFQYYSDLALQQLEDVAIPSKRKEPLKALAHYLLMRDK